MARAIAALLVVVSAAGPAACRSADIAQANDELRDRVVDLEDEVRELRDLNAELEVKLAAAGAATPAGELPERVRASIPRVTRISISRLSHARDDDGDGRVDRLTLYLLPADGRGRFVQLVGEATASATVPVVGGPPLAIGDLTLDAPAVRDAYRSGLTGTHYTIELPVELPEGDPPATCTVQVAFDDALTGRRHSASRTVDLAPSREQRAVEP